MTLNKEELIILNDLGLTNKEIAEKLNVSRSTIVRQKRLYNLNSKVNLNKKENIKCLFCSKDIVCLKTESRKFCSQRCSALYNNYERGHKTIERLNFKTIDNSNVVGDCIFCGKVYEVNRKNLNTFRKYCSIECRAQYVLNLKFEKLESGLSVSSKIAKLYLIKKFGAKCMDCGWDKKNVITGNVPIELEHIDGNSENNSLENLKLLCPNCHSLTPTYKALNKGNGRHKRRERYLQGKSF